MPRKAAHYTDLPGLLQTHVMRVIASNAIAYPVKKLGTITQSGHRCFRTAFARSRRHFAADNGFPDRRERDTGQF